MRQFGALVEARHDLCTLVQIGGLFQSYKLRGISRYGPPYRGIPGYGNSSRYPPLLATTLKRAAFLTTKFIVRVDIYKP